MTKNIDGEKLLKEIEKLKIELSKKKINSFEFSKIKYGIMLTESIITNMMINKKV